MIRASVILLALLGASAAAETGPVVTFDALRIDARSAPGPLTDIGVNNAAEHQAWWRTTKDQISFAARSAPLASAATPALVGHRIVSGDATATTVLDYAQLQAGDTAGLIVYVSPTVWISLQVERIEPADLIAVRLRTSAASPPAGKLIATTALSGESAGKVRLRIERAGPHFRLMYATGSADWQILADSISVAPLIAPSPATGGSLVGVFATDGAPAIRK